MKEDLINFISHPPGNVPRPHEAANLLGTALVVRSAVPLTQRQTRRLPLIVTPRHSLLGPNSVQVAPAAGPRKGKLSGEQARFQGSNVPVFQRGKGRLFANQLLPSERLLRRRGVLMRN